MFSKTALLDAISKGDVNISYEFDISQPTPPRLTEPTSYRPAEPQNLAAKIIEQQFFGDRLGITLGPIVVSDSIRRLPGRTLFKGRAGHFDLRESNGEITIMPRESFAVHSVEKIGLNFNIGAYVLPRLTLGTVGLVVVPTYIDPYWEGILQLYITNLSTHVHRLRFGERIAVCRFYEIDHAIADPQAKSRFAQKSHHYGLNWTRILDTDSTVQPRRKDPVPASFYREALRLRAIQFLRNWSNIFGLAAGAAFIAAVFAYARFESKADQLDKVTAQVSALNTLANQNGSDEKNLDLETPQSGVVGIHIDAAQEQFDTEIILDRRTSPGTHVWFFPVPSDLPVDLSGRTYCTGPDGVCKLVISARRSKSSSAPLDGQIRWLILSR